MERRQMRQVVCAGLALLAVSAPAFAQEQAAPAGFNWYDMVTHMSTAAIIIAIVLFIMSFWSIGVAIERIYTFNQARKQSKLYAPQVAKHLKDGRLKEAIALSQSKDFRYSHLQGRARRPAGISVPAGLQHRHGP